jgi:hypothetical protein
MRVARRIGFIFLVMGMLLIGVWCSTAIWYQSNAGEALRSFLTGVTAVIALTAAACLATRRPWIAVGIYFACFALFLGWWATISPTHDRKWAPDVARVVTATIDGDRLVVNNVRNFGWRSETNFDQIWEEPTPCRRSPT